MSPNIPQYSFNNIGAQTQTQADYPMSYTPASATAQNQPEITASTISATTSLSGGKLQYTPQQNIQQLQQPQLNMQQILGMLQTALVQAGHIPPNQAGAVPQNPVTSAQAPVPQNPLPQNPSASSATQSVDINRLFQTLQSASASSNDNMGFNQSAVSQSDPNLQQAQNQDMPSLGASLGSLENYIGTDAQMVSFDSLGSFPGNVGNLDFDPNVAQYETVDDNSRMSTTRADDETMAAINNLNQS